MIFCPIDNSDSKVILNRLWNPQTTALSIKNIGSIIAAQAGLG